MLDYDRPVELSENIYWVGFNDPKRGLHCNPYLIIDGDEAVLIDGGSRPEFSTVMMKIMQTGLDPRSISKLIYHHYDPDLCGSIPNLEDIIDNPNLELISHTENNVFIRYYSVKSPMRCVQKMGFRTTLKSGRVLRFIPTPYAHSPGSFMTMDEKSGILFSSDIFGSQESATQWRLFFEPDSKCMACNRHTPESEAEPCDETGQSCPWTAMFNFHHTIMTSNKALRVAVRRLLAAKPNMVAPQHGSIFNEPGYIQEAGRRLMAMENIGIDHIDDDEESHGF